MELIGTVIKGIGGFYYVEAADAVYECKAKGIFRKKGISPLAGDNVRITVRANGENTVDEIFERKNYFIRPQVANVDMMLMISSTVEPNVNTVIIDKMIVIAEKKGIEPVLIFTKSDLSDAAKLVEIYSSAGFKAFSSGIEDDSSSIDEIRNIIKGKTVFLTGNTGVGKSTLINRILPGLNLATGEISEKLGRGRHTTRQAELFKAYGGYIIDTPGFSSLDFLRCETVMKDELQYYFREFEDSLGSCFFPDCHHICEKGCSVIERVNSGEISESRHSSYVSIYNEIKNLKEWQL